MNTYDFTFSSTMTNNAALWNITFDMKKYINLIQNIKFDDMKYPVFYNTKCYPWTGKVDKSGRYAKFGCIGAHRLMKILTSVVPQDLTLPKNPCPCGETNKNGNVKKYGSCCRSQVRHMCKTITGENHYGLCVNPLHLQLGIPQENQNDIRQHGTGKGGVYKGQNAPQTNLTDNQVREVWKEIQKMKENKITLKEIAIKHGFSNSCVKDIKRGKAWNHITGLSKDKYNKRRIEIDEVRHQEKMITKKRMREDEKSNIQPAKKTQKLTSDNVRDILKELKQNIKPRVLANKYKVSQTTIRDIKSGRTHSAISKIHINVSEMNNDNNEDDNDDNSDGDVDEEDEDDEEEDDNDDNSDGDVMMIIVMETLMKKMKTMKKKTIMMIIVMETLMKMMIKI
jgi:hypothetical protein